MSMFDSIINDSGEEFGLGDKAGSLLSSLLGLITDQSQGGFAGFLDRFRKTGLGDAVDTWINDEDNIPLSNEQVESALGSDTVNLMAERAAIDAGTTKSALAAMIPRVVDRLTPDAVVPTEDDLLSRIGDYLSADDASATGTAAPSTSETVDRIGTAATERFDRNAAGNLAGNAVSSVDVMDDDANDNSPMKWLLPLILLALLVFLGWAFCGKAEAPTTNTNTASH
jgi:uncharacterized protein YidB (DUF937 family)